MRTRIKFYYLCIFLIPILAVGFAEWSVRHFLGIVPEVANTIIKPHGFFRPDSILGWRNGISEYTAYTASGDSIFHFHTNGSGKRITSDSHADEMNLKPSIHLYGCSYTFGYSVEVTATLSYKLQRLEPAYHVINKAVPAYGLCQMYLSLQHSLSVGDTPKIAVFNYGAFQDSRTALSLQMSGGITNAILQGGSADLYKSSFYPYFDTLKNDLRLCNMPFNEIPHYWVGSDKLALIILANSIYMNRIDDPKANFFHLTSLRTALKMMNYCKENGIIPIFANFKYR